MVLRSQYRPDHPTIAYTTRGSKRAAPELESEEGRRVAIQRYQEDKWSANSKGNADSRWDTWTQVASIMGVHPLPLTEESVDKVIACFKAKGYRSVSKYVGAARRRHLHIYGSISEYVELTIKDGLRSARRGIGPAELKDSFHVEGLADFVVVNTKEQVQALPDITPSPTSSSRWPAAGG